MQKETSEKYTALLKEYLNQYNDCKKYKHDLEKRLLAIDREMEAPIGGQGYSPLPSNTNMTGAGSASLIFRKAEIEDRIMQQQEQMVIIINNIMSILDHLPVGNRGRRILEYKYIDSLPWETIYKKMHLSKTPCFNYTNEAYKKLLECKRVVYILEEYEKNIQEK